MYIFSSFSFLPVLFSSSRFGLCQNSEKTFFFGEIITLLTLPKFLPTERKLDELK
jgi:hypothetical protein